MNGHPRERLSAYLDRELSREEAEAIEVHLRGCTECGRELALMRDLGGAVRNLTGGNQGRSVWAAVHRRITRPIGWVLLVAGCGIWAGLALAAWLRAELTLEWLAVTGIGVGIFLLLIGVTHEQYREWKDTRYKDVER